MYEQTTTDAFSQGKGARSYRGLKIVAVITILLIAFIGIGYSVYFWQQNKDLQSDIDNKSKQIQNLNKEVNSLKLIGSNATSSNQNVISIRELGISITVPDSLKDLSYSYKSSAVGTNITKMANLSTQAITDEYAATSECASSSSSPPMGALYKVAGTYPEDVHFGPQLVKQFSSYYIAYLSPQSACSSRPSSGLNPTYPSLADFKNSLSTVKEL